VERLGFKATESKANFMFITHPAMSAKSIFQQLRDKGVLVRYFDQPRIDEYLRVSIGTDEEMDAFIAALTDIVAG
jgi:histidinol-phosphate aminotransferase